MPERVGAVQHRRRLGAQRAQRIAAGEEVAHERLAARDQLVGEDVPGACLEPLLPEERCELRRALRTDVEVVVEDLDRLDRFLSREVPRGPRATSLGTTELKASGPGPGTKPNRRSKAKAAPRS